MKKNFTLIIGIVFLFLFTSQTFAQKYPDRALGDTANYPYWQEMMQDPNANFHATVSAFNKYWEGRTDYKGNGYKVFKRWEYINRDIVKADGTLPTAGEIQKELEKYSKSHDTKSASGNWTNIGPTAYPENATGQPTGIGRVNCIGFDPVLTNVIYAGTPSGGLWKSTDLGANWTSINQSMPTLGVSSILVHPSSGLDILIGTGDRDASDSYGLGVYRSTDGGTTWAASNSGMGNVDVGMMIRNPSNANMILAATSDGIYKSIDGGSTWVQKYGSGDKFMDIKFKPGDFNVVYATSSGYFYRSTDAGENWSEVILSVSGNRLVIGVSPANSAIVYLLQTNGPFAGLLKSANDGVTFSTQSTTPNIEGYVCDGNDGASQAFYDLCITVDQSNADIIYAGGINMWKSTDGGVNWVINSHWIGRDFGTTCSVNVASVHADQHYLGWSPHNGNLYLGNDGGVYHTANGGTDWLQITNGLGIAQIYRIGQSATQKDLVINGAQDNGTHFYNGGTFTTVKGGDGMECLIDYSDVNYRYATGPSGALTRFVTSGSYLGIKNNITETGEWVTPYTLHATVPGTMFAGYENVWRSTNVKAATSGAVTWTAISTGETATCKILVQSAADVDVLYAARYSNIMRSDNANDATPTWTLLTQPDAGNTTTGMATHPTDANIVYATAGTKVYKSSDKGANWTNISGTLPSININCVVFDKNSVEDLYIGTKASVFYKHGAADWVLFSTGLPITDFRDLEIYYDPTGTQHRLRAATYGRGLWESDLAETGVINPTNLTAVTPSSSKIDLSWVLNVAGNNVVLAYNTSSTFGTPVNGTSYSAGNPITGGGTVLYNGSALSFNHTALTTGTTYYYKLWSYDGATEYSTGTTANAKPEISVANFTVNNTFSCTGSLTVTFTDASTGTYNSWAWDVDNNGTTDYTTQNPTHTYSSPGMYSVKLTISNGDDNMLKENLILVMNSEPTVNTGCALTSHTNTGFGIGIQHFVLGNIDNTTPLDDSYYKNYACSSWTNLQLNTSYNVTIDTDVDGNNEGAKVYIDYDDNGTFDDPGELAVSFPVAFGSRTLLFTTPSSGIILNKALRLRVLANWNYIPANACDNGGYGQAEDYTVYFASTTTSTWAGTTDNDWHTASNWDNGVPDAATNVIIPVGLSNYPTLTAAGVCHNFTIQSDASGTGSIIGNENLTISGTTSIQRYVAGYVSASNGWHLISSPVASQAISGGWTPGGSTYDFFAFDESLTTLNWLNQKIPGNSITSFVPGKGYLVSYQVTDTKAFTGAMNSANVSMSPLANTPGSAYPGWNLVGNPFASAIDYSAGTWTKTNIDGVMQVWNSATASYKTATEVGNIIPAMNGFMVHTTGSGAITIPLDARTHNATNWYKASSGDFFLLKANDLDGHTSQSSIIRLNAMATEAYDPEFDSYFLSGFAPMFYSRLGNEYFALNTLPEISKDFEIPFEFIRNGGVNFEIEASGFESLQTTSDVFLKDKKLGITHNLSENATYKFTADDNDDVARFELQFKTDAIPSQAINAFFSENTLYVSGVEGTTNVGVYNVQGQKIQDHQLKQIGLQSLALKLATGVYFARIANEGNTVTLKMIVQ